MKYGVFGRIRKAVAITISMALVICAAPVVQVSAEETETGTTVIKQVNFGVVNDSIAPGIDKDKITLSISSSFNNKLDTGRIKI